MSHESDVFFGGILDSLSPQYPLHLLGKSSQVKNIIGISVGFNFLIFVFNVYYSYYVSQWYQNTWNWFYPGYVIFWAIPSFTAALVLNATWSGQLAKLVCKEKYGEPKHQYGYIETIYGTFLIYIFHAMLTTVKYSVSVSVLRLPILYMGYAWLSGFYLFETRLIYKGYTLPQRIEFLQRRWLYFLGYGTPLALIYMILPYNTVYTMYYFLSDMMVLNTIHLKPKKYNNLVSLPIFGVVRSFTNWLTSLIHFNKQKRN